MKRKLNYILHRVLKAAHFRRDYHLIFKELKHFRWTIVLAILFALIGACLEGITVGFIVCFLQGLTTPDQPPIQTGLQWIDTVFLATQATVTQRTYRLSWLLLVIVWLRSGVDYSSNVYSKIAACKLGDRLRYRIFDQLESFRLSFYTTTNPGTIVSTLRSEVTQVQNTFSNLLGAIIQLAKLLVYLVAMLLLSWPLFFTAVISFSLLSMSLTGLTHKAQQAGLAIPKANRRFTVNLLAFLNGIRTVQGAGAQQFERQKYSTITEQVYRTQIRVHRLLALVQPIMEGLGVTLLVSMVVVVYGKLISTDHVMESEFLTFLFILIRAIPMISTLNNTRISCVAALGAMESVTDLLRRDDKPYFHDGNTPFVGLQRSIDFESVDFAYTPNEPVLQDITLSIGQGKMMALVGASGAGKTTLVDLLPRFYDPTQGRILIDGIDIRALKINSLRHKMAIVSQDTFIFHDTARANIAYGLEGVDDNEIWRAAQQANALEFILELPEGFETILGERGVRLSGGQRQRIAIARALLRNPEILILDEATSALDSATERKIQTSLNQLAKGRTVVAIAHRLSTIVNADKVVVLEKGRIVEQGRYQDLIQVRGHLWKYHQMQFKISPQP